MLIRLPPTTTLLPYTTLFRSQASAAKILAWDPDTLFLTHFGPHHGARQHLQAMFENIDAWRSEEHTSELQSHSDLVCRLLLEKKKCVELHQKPGLRTLAHFLP